MVIDSYCMHALRSTLEKLLHMVDNNLLEHYVHVVIDGQAQI